jgi:transposase
LALGRWFTASYQRCRCRQDSGTFTSDQPAKSTAASAVASATVKRSPATKGLSASWRSNLVKKRLSLAIDVSPANRHDTKAIVPVLRELADGGFQGPALGDLGYRGKRLAEAGQALGITVEAIARGRDGQFIPAGICWVVERPFAWLSRYRRLNTIFERSKEHLIAFVAIAFISILSRRLKRLVVEELSA